MYRYNAMAVLFSREIVGMRNLTQRECNGPVVPIFIA